MPEMLGFKAGYSLSESFGRRTGDGRQGKRHEIVK